MPKYRKNAVFGTANDFTRLSRDQKAKIIYLAEQRERLTKAKGKRDGIIGQSALALLRLMLFRFHNPSTGRLDPSYDRLQEISGFCRQTIANALHALEMAGIMRITRRLIRVMTEHGLQCQQYSNAYSFPAFASESRTQDVSTKSIYTLNDRISADTQETGLFSSIQRLRRLMELRKSAEQRNNLSQQRN